MALFKIQVIAPQKDVFDVDRVKREVEGVLDREGQTLKRRFTKTTNSWAGEKPAFKVKIGISPALAYVWCFPSGTPSAVAKWVRLDKGTEAHDIAARNAPFLIFPFQGPGKSYVAKTRPGWLGSRGGGRVGPRRRFKVVRHPGHEERRWSVVLGEERLPSFQLNMQLAVNRGLS